MTDESNHKPYINTPEAGVPAPFDPFAPVDEEDLPEEESVLPWFADALTPENWNEIEPHLRKIGREAVAREREKRNRERYENASPETKALADSLIKTRDLFLNVPEK